MAWSLGYADGERLPRAELLAACARIRRVVDVPLSVDIERGHGADAAQVRALVRELAAIGASAVNIEDGLDEATGALRPPQALLERVAAIRELGRELDVPLFVNVRLDAYLARGLAGRPFDEALRRARLAAASGADGVFVPGLSAVDEIARFAQAIELPLNVYAGGPGTPAVQALAAAGVRRVSLGCGPQQAALGLVAEIAGQALREGRYDAMTARMTPVSELNALMRCGEASA
jgi:2-methylisocitrate lyase-like PEP mutase family enzyme